MAAITRAELSRRLGVSRAAITLAIKDGRLEPALLADGKLDAEQGVELFKATSRRMVELPEPDAAEWANALLDLECWGPPPWSLSQWISLRDVFQFGCELAAEGRIYSPAAFHALGIELEEQIKSNEQSRAPQSLATR